MDRPSRRQAWWLATGCFLACSVAIVLVNQHGVLSNAGVGTLHDMVSAAQPPDATFLGRLGTSTLTTLSYAVASTGIAVPVALVLATWLAGLGPDVVRSSRTPARAAKSAFAWLMTAARSIPELVWVLVLVPVTGLGSSSALIALVVCQICITTRVYLDILAAAPGDSYAVLRAMGVTSTAARLGTVRDAMPELSTFALYRLECAIRTSVAIGVVGAGGLGFELRTSLDSFRVGEVMSVVSAIIALCIAVDALTAAARRWLLTGSSTKAQTRLLRTVSVFAASGWVVAMVWLAPVPHRSAQELAAAAVGRIEALGPSADWIAWAAPTAWAAIVTLAIGAVAAMASAGLAVVISLVVGRPSGWPMGRARLCVRGVLVMPALAVARSLHPALLAVLVLIVMRPGPLPAVVALTVYNVGVLTRLMVNVVDTAPAAAYVFARASGSGHCCAAWVSVWPEVKARLGGLTFYRWDVLSRESIAVGVVSAGGLGEILREQNALLDDQGTGAALAGTIAVGVLVEILWRSARFGRASSPMPPVTLASRWLATGGDDRRSGRQVTHPPVALSSDDRWPSKVLH